MGEPIRVNADAGNEDLELVRQRVENELNRVTERAYALADQTSGQTESA